MLQISYQIVAGTITAAIGTGPNGHVTSYCFGPGRVLAETINPQEQRTQSARDFQAKLLTQHTDVLGNSTQYIYDRSGNVLTITHPLDQTIGHATRG